MSEQNAWHGSSGETSSEPYDVGRGTLLGRVFWIRNEPNLQVALWSVNQDDLKTTPLMCSGGTRLFWFSKERSRSTLSRAPRFIFEPVT
jgi:hypothetical protein